MSSSPSSNYNALYDLTSLKNDYCALRHGQSMANVAKIISSSPDVATKQHGLSELGREQANQAGHDVLDFLSRNDYQGVAILSSDFLRAKETAQSVVRVLKEQFKTPLFTNDVMLETRLRERFFGSWDGGSDDNYKEVWKDDAVDPSHTFHETESVHSVMQRTTSAIVECEEKWNNYLVVCVAHGDVLQILQTAFLKHHGSEHRSLPHLETATLRPLLLGEAKQEEEE